MKKNYFERHKTSFVSIYNFATFITCFRPHAQKAFRIHGIKQLKQCVLEKGERDRVEGMLSKGLLLTCLCF